MLRVGMIVKAQAREALSASVLAEWFVPTGVDCVETVTGVLVALWAGGATTN